MLNKHFRRPDPRKQIGPESGVTILEMVVAMLVLTIGLLGLAASIGYAVTVSNKGRNVTNTKLLVVSMLEQMETIRNTQSGDLSELTFGQIANTGSVDDTGADRSFPGFPTTFEPVSSNPGPDGLFGTTDDLVSGAGPDNLYGTSDDVVDNSLKVGQYTRQILITSLNTNLKRVQVTLRYPDAGGQMRDMVGVSYLNNDSRSNFR
jgi:type II secretory pathway pseudopilin PulG